MRNLCNKANVPYLLAGAFATLTLIASGALVAAPYVGFLSSVAAFNVALPVALSLFTLSVLVLAFSYKMVSNNKKVEVEKSKFAQREQEEATSRVRQLTEENRYLKSDIERLNETNDQLEKQLTYAQKKTEDELSGMKKQKEIIERQAEKQKIRVQKELNQKTQGLDDVKQQLETSSKNIDDMGKEVDELLGKLKESEDYSKKLQEVLKAKQNELDNVKEQKVKLERKLEDICNLEYSNDSYVKFREALKVKQDKVELLEGQISQIVDFMTQTIRSNELSEDDLRNVKESASVGSKFEEFVTLLSIENIENKRRLFALTEENQGLKDQLGSWKEKVVLSKDLESSLLDTRQQLSETIQEKECAEKKMKESDEREVVARKNSIKRSEEASELKRKLHQEALLRKDAEKKVEELKAEVERIKIELSKLSQGLSQEVSLRKGAEKKVNELDDILSQKTQVIDELKRKLTELENKFSSKLRGKDELIEKLHVSKTELEEQKLEAEIKKLESEIELEEERKMELKEQENEGLRESQERLQKQGRFIVVGTMGRGNSSITLEQKIQNGKIAEKEHFGLLEEKPDKVGQESQCEIQEVENEDPHLAVSESDMGGEHSRTEPDEPKEVNASEAEDKQSRKDSNEELEVCSHELDDQTLAALESKDEKLLKKLEELKSDRKAIEKRIGLSFTSKKGIDLLERMRENKPLAVNLDEIIKAKDNLVEGRKNLESQVETLCEICVHLNQHNNLLLQRSVGLKKELNQGENKIRMQKYSSRSKGDSSLQSQLWELSDKLEELKKGKQDMLQQKSREDLNWLGTINSSTLPSQKEKVAKIIDNITKKHESLSIMIGQFNALRHQMSTISSSDRAERKSKIGVGKRNSLPTSRISFPGGRSDIMEFTPVNSSEYSSDVSESTAKKDLLREKSFITSTPSRPREGLEKGYFGTHLSLIQNTEISSICNSTSGKSDQSVLESQNQKEPVKKSKIKSKKRKSYREESDKENLGLQSKKNHSISNISISHF